MTGAALTVSLDDKQLRRSLGRVAALAQRPEALLKRIGMGLAATSAERFETQTDPWGHPWAELSPAYAAIKTRGGRILTASGMLHQSLHYVVSGRQVQVGSNLVYAAVHQFGATIKPKNAKALVFHLASGLVHAHSVSVPARPYLGLGHADIEAVQDAVAFELRRALRA
jgi:phage virion morphogenesis protein